MHGANAALTVSIQPLKRKKRTRRLVDGEEWGAFHAHLLWKRRETGAVARIKQLLAESSELLTAIWAAHGVSRGGAAITHKTLLAVLQMLDSIKDGIKAAETAYASCTEPMMLSLTVASPAGAFVTLATASAQPTKKRKQDPELGGYHACHLFKHAKAGVIPYFKELLRQDSKLRAAVMGSPTLSTSKKGKRITHISLMAESLADRVWSTMTEDEKRVWKGTSVACKRSLDGVNWEELASTARRCKTFIRFVVGLHALVGTSAQAAGDERVDGLPSFLRRFM